ncbi:epsin-1-like [Hippocampus zosterae]|uniref:epsin-1-like n=1 Tax=Hippocampus zosterae TaxID=109293 RepID=UPI00223E3CB4|nr:epsin-1-like [Hippocampus zosterae]XP_051927062.1 epsin-1-like [Hippocampus zosterae]
MTSSMLRRQLKNLVQNYSEAEVKVREATSNDPWGPSSSQMADISDLTYNVVACNEIMTMLWKRLKDDRNWRHIHKSLTLLEYLLKTGDDRVLLKMKDNIYIVKALTEYRFVEKDGKDQGTNVREKAKVVLVLMEDDDKLKEERDFAVKTREKTSKGSTASSSDAVKDPSYKPCYVPGTSGLPSLDNIPSVADLTASFAARKEERLKQEQEKKEAERRAQMSEDELKWEDAGKGGAVANQAWSGEKMEEDGEEEAKPDPWGDSDRWGECSKPDVSDSAPATSGDNSLESASAQISDKQDPPCHPLKAQTGPQDPFMAQNGGPQRAESFEGQPKNQEDPFTSSNNDPFNTPKDDPFNAPKNDPFSAAKNDPFNAPKEDPFNTPKEDPFNAPKNDPFSAAKNDPFNAPKDDPFTAPKDDPFNAPKDDPFTAPKDDPFNAPKNDPFNAPKEDPFNTPKDHPFDTPKNDPFNAPKNDKVNSPKDDPFGTPKDDPFFSAPKDDPFAAPQVSTSREEGPPTGPTTPPKDDPFKTPQDDPFSAASVAAEATAPPKDDPFATSSEKDPFSAPLTPPKEEEGRSSDPFAALPLSSSRSAGDGWGAASDLAPPAGSDPWGGSGVSSPVDDCDPFGDTSKARNDPWGTPGCEGCAVAKDAWEAPKAPSPTSDPFGDSKRRAGAENSF